MLSISTRLYNMTSLHLNFTRMNCKQNPLFRTSWEANTSINSPASLSTTSSNNWGALCPRVYKHEYNKAQGLLWMGCSSSSSQGSWSWLRFTDSVGSLIELFRLYTSCWVFSFSFNFRFSLGTFFHSLVVMHFVIMLRWTNVSLQVFLQ